MVVEKGVYPDRVKVISHDLTIIVDASRVSLDGATKIDRGEGRPILKITVHRVRAVGAHNLALVVDVEGHAAVGSEGVVDIAEGTAVVKKSVYGPVELW